MNNSPDQDTAAPQNDPGPVTPGLFASLGVLRIALFALLLLNSSLPLLYAELVTPTGSERDLWQVFATLISPVLAPLFIVVLLFDYIMSRVRASDAAGAERRRFVIIGRIELVVMAVTLAFWIPFFVNLLS